jgi:biopolymer transport protein ExbD
MRMESLKTSRLASLFARRPFNFTLRMAPMIDIIFLLLIFFLVCAKWRPQEQFLPLQLSTAGAAEVPLVRAEPLVIHIASAECGCSVRIGQSSIVRISQDEVEQDLLTLVEQLQASLTAQHRFVSDPVGIICEPDVKWDYFAKIYNVLYGVGLTDITFNLTESP